MNKYRLVLLSGISILVCIILFIIVKYTFFPAQIHYHAGFLVYLDGKLIDFSKNQYMTQDYCKLESEKLTPAQIQIDKAHLHDNIGDVVHIHAPGARWKDLFYNLKFTFPASRKISGYIKGQEVPNILDQPITPYESVIITIGSSKGVNLTKYVTKKQIREVEKISESCGN